MADKMDPAKRDFPDVVEVVVEIPRGSRNKYEYDMQAGVLSESWDAARIIQSVSRAVERARAQVAPVIWVQHSDDDLPYGSAAWKWVPELSPAAGEPLIHKHFNSSFERATAYAALDRGYDLTLVKDAHTTGAIDLGDGTKIEASNIVNELNIAMTWLRYPGRTNGTAMAEHVDFAGPGGAP